MRGVLLAAAAAVAAFVSSAQAADCTNGPFLTRSQMQAAFNTKYLYGGTAPNNYDELHNFPTPNGGTLQDFKKGPNDPVDPRTSTPGGYATFSTVAGSNGNPDTIKYVYKSGYTTPALSVVQTGASTFLFCSGGSVFTSSTAGSAPGF